MQIEILKAAPAQGGLHAASPPLLFIHGAFAGAWCWLPHFLPWFAEKGFACAAPSLRGHGASEGRGLIHDFGIQDYVDDIASTAEDLDGPPILIGHSMGGYVAMHYAARYPVAGVVLLASVPPFGLAGAQMSMAFGDPRFMFDVAGRQLGLGGILDTAQLREVLFAAGCDPSVAEKSTRHLDAESNRALIEMSMGPHPNVRRLADSVSVAVLGGDGDRLIRPAFVRATGRVLGTGAEIMPGIAHAMMLDRHWERVAARVHAVVANVVSDQTSAMRSA